MELGLGLGDSMKNIVAKGIQTELGTPYSGTGYVNEKLYMLLQLYLQNKGWNHVELLQCFSDLKDPSMIPSASIIQLMASRITLDSQGRLVLRDNGKIILPCEHFANAVMLKHMNGPHGLHLGLEATLRTVMESYTMGRENFGMEKEFVAEVVNNCPNPACRYYKTQLDLTHNKPTYLPEPSQVQQHQQQQLQQQLQQHQQQQAQSSMGESSSDYERVSSKGTPVPPSPQTQQKVSELLKSNLDNLESITSAHKDLLAVHNGSWMNNETDNKRHMGTCTEVGQEKIVRAFGEIMKNMSRMKTCVRPAMCKPYGKQSEALQKTLMDTIQLVQSLRSILPPPHIAVSSWKNEDKHTRKVPNLEDLCEPVRKVE